MPISQGWINILAAGAGLISGSLTFEENSKKGSLFSGGTYEYIAGRVKDLPADAQRLDRFHDGGNIAAFDVLEQARQPRLVEDLKVAGGVAAPPQGRRDDAAHVTAGFVVEVTLKVAGSGGG
jgi:hypothetical protein